MKILKYTTLFPKLITILIISHLIYYWNIIFSEKVQLKILVFIAIIIVIISYYFTGFLLKKIIGRSNRKKNDWSRYKKIKKFAILCILIGCFSHIVFYGENFYRIVTYSDRYLITRGNGVYSVLFNGVIIGCSLLEYCFKNKKGTFKLKVFSRTILFLYGVFYFFILSKRKQLLLIIILLLTIYGVKVKFKQKISIYIGAILLYAIFVIYGQCRGYFVVHGISGLFSFALDNMQLNWFYPSSLEGKYTSMILRDVYAYTEYYGYTSKILLGTMLCMIPRKLLGGNKLFAFQEWYAFTFRYNDYIKGGGYAGSMIAELYLLGGVIAIVVGYTVIGALYSYFEITVRSRISSNEENSIILGLGLYTALFLPRFDLASILIDIVFLYYPIIYGIRLLKNSNSKYNMEI